MDIVVIGSGAQAEECRRKFGESHTWRVFEEAGRVDKPDSIDLVFDFVSSADHLHGLSSAVFVDTSFVRLSTLAERRHLNRKLAFGFCGLPTLLDREVLEVAKLPEGDLDLLTALCRELGTSFEVVADQAGLVSPRVICMIINEAYYTLEEGTATREDIDLAMKLGTNYPFGPFEWSERIGLKQVVRVLMGAQEETGDERYRVCPLLMDRSRLA